MKSTACIVVMTKFPATGQVKTRLMPALSADEASEVHRIFLIHTIERLTRESLPPVYICFDPPDLLSKFRALLPQIPENRFLSQTPGDLGQRIAAGFCGVRESFHRVLFLGIDSPDAPMEAIAQQTAASVAHVTLGPTADGGFWSLGLRSDVDAGKLLDGIAWSSGKERQQTIEHVGRLGYTIELLQSWDDVDHPADLARLIQRLERSDDEADRRLLKRLQPVCEKIL